MLIPSYIAKNRTPRYSIVFTTANSSSTINKLPLLQTQYAQGRNIAGDLVARGPEEGEPFSWGPALEELAHNNDGGLIPRQPGLRPAKAFNPYETLRSGFATDNHLQLFASMGNYILKTGYANKFSAGTLPLNNYQRHAVDFSLHTQWGAVHPRVYVSYAGAKERLPLKGTNGASILESLYTTPPTFDLKNGVTGSRPWKNPATYLSADGKQRSFAPGQADHPYWLLNNLPDQQEEQKVG